MQQIFVLFQLFQAREETHNINEALNNENWIMEMLEELNQFDKYDVWVAQEYNQ